jgi:putative transposase
LKEAEAGVQVSEICRRMGISEQTFYAWKKKYLRMGVSELRESRYSA